MSHLLHADLLLVLVHACSALFTFETFIMAPECSVVSFKLFARVHVWCTNRLVRVGTVDGQRHDAVAKKGLWSEGTLVMVEAFVALMGVDFFLYMQASAVSSLLGLYIVDTFSGCGEGCWSLILVALSVCMLVSNGLVLPLSLRFIGRTGTIWLALCASFLHCLVYAFAKHLWMILANFTLAALSYMGYSVLNDLTAEAVPPELVGTAMGLVSSMWTLADVVSPLLSAFLFIEYSHTDLSHLVPGLPFVVSAVFVVCAMCCFYVRNVLVGRRKQGVFTGSYGEGETKRRPLLLEEERREA